MRITWKNGLPISLGVILGVVQLSCTSAENDRLRTFLGPWELEATCVAQNAGLEGSKPVITVSRVSAIVSDAEPDGVWVKVPWCAPPASADSGRSSNLYLQYDHGSMSYRVTVADEGSKSQLSWLVGGYSRSQHLLTYSDVGGYTSTDGPQTISIKKESDGHIWAFRRTALNGVVNSVTLRFKKGPA